MKKLLSVLVIIALCNVLQFSYVFSGGGGKPFDAAFAEAEIEVARSYSTGHFSFIAPSGWHDREKDGWHYFYAEELGSLSGGLLCVQENYLGLVEDSKIENLYDTFGGGIQRGKAYVGGYKAENITVDDEQAILFEYQTKVGSDVVAATTLQYYINGYALTMTLADKNAENLKERLLDIASTVKYVFVKHPQTTAFGRKFVQVIGHSVINQNGYDCLVVEYRWFHTLAEPTAFMYSFSSEAYQNGIQLQSYILLDGDSEMTTKIEKSTFLRCYDVFLLRDSSDVKVRIDEIFDFSGKYKDVEYIASLND